MDLPTEGNGVLAVATTAGRADAPIVSKVLHFSGYDWTVQTAASDRGGKPNVYDPRNAWVDNDGYLHLRMQEHRRRLDLWRGESESEPGLWVLSLRRSRCLPAEAVGRTRHVHGR